MSYYKSRQSMVRGSSGLYYRQDATDTTDAADTKVETDDNAAESTQPTVTFNIPALIRVLELIREDVVSDEILHYVVEKLVEVGFDCNTIDMDDYDEIAAVVPKRLAMAQRRLKDGRRI